VWVVPARYVPPLYYQTPIVPTSALAHTWWRGEDQLVICDTFKKLSVSLCGEVACKGGCWCQLVVWSEGVATVICGVSSESSAPLPPPRVLSSPLQPPRPSPPCARLFPLLLHHFCCTIAYLPNSTERVRHRLQIDTTAVAPSDHHQHHPEQSNAPQSRAPLRRTTSPQETPMLQQELSS